MQNARPCTTDLIGEAIDNLREEFVPYERIAIGDNIALVFKGGLRMNT
jgi:hypothetical protein